MRLFLSCPPRTRDPFVCIAKQRGLEIVDEIRDASVAVFDLSTFAATTYYELGIALALRRDVLLVADEGTDPPFDLGRHVHFYEPHDADLDRFCDAHLMATVTLRWEAMIPTFRATLDLTGLDATVCFELGVADTLRRETSLVADEEAIRRLPRDFPAMAPERVSPCTSADTRR
jgi:hypothetical protein